MDKDYKRWLELKVKINNSELHKDFHIYEGEVWWCVFGENIGIETDGKEENYLRPALIIKVFNINHVWIVPITSNSSDNKFHIKMSIFSNISSVSISQIRTISTKRLLKFMTRINRDEFDKVNQSIISFLQKENSTQSGVISRPLGNNTLSLADSEDLSIEGDGDSMSCMTNDFSPIQNHILSKLKNAKKMRYSEMQLEETPNDLYNYHLQFLVKKGFVLKDDDGYTLSENGIKYVADPYSKNNAITSLFKVNVITVVSRRVNGKIEILNQIRKSNPSYGKVGVMGGVVLKGETIESAATRKLKQETGLEAKLRLLGTERRIMYKSGELFSDVIFPITYTDDYSGELLIDSDFGHNMWVSIDEAIKNESDEFDSIKSIKKVLEAIKNESLDKLPLFFEESIKDNSAKS